MTLTLVTGNLLDQRVDAPAHLRAHAASGLCELRYAEAKFAHQAGHRMR